MRRSTRIILAATLVAGILSAALPPSAGAFDAAGQKCRASIAKAGAGLSKSLFKVVTGCHKGRNKSGALSATDCNSISGADAKGGIPGAETKFGASVAKACTGGSAALLYTGCPAPCDSTVPTVSTFPQVADCLKCLARDNTEGFADAAYGTPSSPAANAANAACHGGITKATASLYASVLKTISACQTAAEKTGGESITACTDTNFASLTSAAYDAAKASIQAACAAVTFPAPSLDPCGGSTSASTLATCAADEARDAAQTLVTQFFQLSAPVVTTTTTTTTTLLAGDPQCPDIGELRLYSHDSSVSCTSNSDCSAPRYCDTSLGYCVTDADLDSGWTGLSHNADIDDGVRTRARLYCPGPAPTCGQCDVVGIDPEPGNCRCAGNTRTVCTHPFAASASECGGNACECYFGAPFPLNSGGTPACVVNRFAQDITGTANVDAGSGAITASLRTRVYLGATSPQPCPVCGGKCSNDQAKCVFDSDCTGGATCVMDTPDDGNRDGKCVGGDSDGLSCDAQGTNAGSPAKFGGGGGGMYSLDCLPSSGANVSGAGLKIVLAQTTGSSSLSANVDCDGAGAGTANCPCLVCSKDTSAPCNSDSDCAAQGGSCSTYAASCNTNADCGSVNVGTCTALGGTRCSGALSKNCSSNADCLGVNAGTCKISSCSAKGTGGFPSPNGCDGGLCSDIGGGQGQCTNGPDTKYCDGLLKKDGRGILTCFTNADCLAVDAAAGNCSITERAACFLDPIVATGSPDPNYPKAVATFCVPPTSNSGINAVAGLPGPGRVVSQGEGKTFCAGNHAVQYQPGVGGCP